MGFAIARILKISFANIREVTDRIELNFGMCIMLRTHLLCKMSAEANARCFSSLTGHTCAALVASNTMEIHNPKAADTLAL